MTRKQIRNPEAFHNAEEKRSRRQHQAVEEIARRLDPILREKHNGEIVAPCIEAVWITLARGGGIGPHERRRARQDKVCTQVLMKLALELVVARGDISMSVMTNGEVVLSAWPPVEHDPIAVDPVENEERYQEMALSQIPNHRLRSWGVV